VPGGPIDPVLVETDIPAARATTDADDDDPESGQPKA
jgi:hypothetical protein